MGCCIGRSKRLAPEGDQQPWSQQQQPAETEAAAHDATAVACDSESYRDSPHSPNQISDSPHSHNERSDSPHSPKEISYSPHSPKEISYSPHSPKEISYSPHSPKEISDSPHSPKEISDSPPSHNERSDSPVLSESRADADAPSAAELRPQHTDFSQIDQHVRQTPQSAAENLQTLAAYLTSTATSDLEKVRAIYKWVTANIEYDADVLFGRKKRGGCNATSALRTGKAICAGYAAITKSLCNHAGLECRQISGYSKVYGYNPLVPLSTLKRDHAWNAVKVDGEWKFLECTWGSGYLDKKQAFRRKVTDFYFCTDPSVFVETHFPSMGNNTKVNKQWQLLQNPIDLHEFHRRVIRSESCFKHQVELVSHTSAVVEVDSEVTMRFRGLGKRLTMFSAAWEDSTSGKRNSRGIITVLDHRDNVATVTAAPPQTAAHCKLVIFATTSPGGRLSEPVTEYQVIAKQSSSQRQHYFNDFYGVHGDPEKLGFLADFPGNSGFWIRANGNEHELRLPTSRAVAVICSLKFAGKRCDQFSFVQMDGNCLSIRVRMPSAGLHRLLLFYKANKKNLYTHFASFLLECSSSSDGVCAFPTKFLAANTQRVVLEQPLHRQLPANSLQRFKFQSPTICKVLVNNKVFRRSGSGFDFQVNTGSPGRVLRVFGSANANARTYGCLYQFRVV